MTMTTTETINALAAALQVPVEHVLDAYVEQVPALWFAPIVCAVLAVACAVAARWCCRGLDLPPYEAGPYVTGLFVFGCAAAILGLLAVATAETLVMALASPQAYAITTVLDLL